MRNPGEAVVNASATTLAFALGLAGGGLIACLCTWYAMGFMRSQHALEETRMTSHVLREQGKSLSPQLREYLKGRIYWNAAEWIAPRDHSGVPVDHGPIDVAVLGELNVAKDNTPPADLYVSALKRHAATD